MNDTVHILEQMPSRIPISGTFELTVRCNLHCKMCLFRHDDCENSTLIANELTAEQWINLGRQVAEAGTMNLLITGGEPMLRPDFCEIWEGIYKQGFLITLYTNATLVTEKIMETLRKYPPHRIGVTIYGASPGTYEKVTGNANGYDQMLKGLKELISLPSKMEYRTTVIKDNYQDVSMIEELVRQLSEGEATLTSTRMVHPVVRGGCANVASCRLSPKDNVALSFRRSEKRLKEIAEKGRKAHLKIKLTKRRDCDGDVKYSFFGCDAGMSSYTVTHDGFLLPCQILGIFKTEVKESEFSAAWKKLPHKIELPKLCKKCRECEISDYCSACPASRLAESGDMGGWSDYICEDAEEMKKFIELL